MFGSILARRLARRPLRRTLVRRTPEF